MLQIEYLTRKYQFDKNQCKQEITQYFERYLNLESIQLSGVSKESSISCKFN